MTLASEAARIANRYVPEGTALAVVPLLRGHINDSFRVAYRDGERVRALLLQRINQNVFTAPGAVMGNIVQVTKHLTARLDRSGVDDLERRTLQLVLSRDNAPWVRSEDGSWWRAFRYVEGSVTIEAAAPQPVEDAARLYGQFQAMLADAECLRLVETIPHFHDTPLRLDTLERAASDDPCNRRRCVEVEIEKMLEHRSLARRLEDLRKSGQIPVRIVHNDTKLDNILFDAATGEALCVIDLDTVMPGLAPHDFGDMVRSMTANAPEDATDLESVYVREELFAAVARGYLDGSSQCLTSAERDHLVGAAQIITLETAARFLTDHLLGDVYFRVHRPGHNLDRARAQLRLFESLLASQDRLEEIVRVISSGRAGAA